LKQQATARFQQWLSSHGKPSSPETNATHP
jgi:hypothetical protein